MEEIERFRLSTRVLHWAIVIFTCLLGASGLCIYISQIGGWVGQGGYVGYIHRVCAILFVLSAVIYLVTNFKSSIKFLKEAFVWGLSDLGWALAAPDYYFGGDPEKMPPQEHINTGQKLYWLAVIIGVVVFLVTGILMWAFRDIVSESVFMWSLLIHDVAFIGAMVMVALHLYLGSIHPVMTESLKSMVTGKASIEYCEHHHGRWLRHELKKKESES